MPLSAAGEQKHWGILILMINSTTLLKIYNPKNLMFHFYLPVNESVGWFLFVFKPWKSN